MKLINVAHAGVISNAPSVSSVGMNVFYFLLSVVGIIAIIVLVVYGMKYLVSGGDDKMMEGSKKAVSYAIIGIALAMGGMIVVNLIGKIFQGQ